MTKKAALYNTDRIKNAIYWNNVGGEQTVSVIVKTEAQIEKMRVAGLAAGKVLEKIGPLVRPGISTGEIDAICHEFMVNELRVVPAPLNYRGFPKAICTSVNNVICHGIPGEKRLKNADIINIDITVIADGFHGDTSKMYYVGEPGVAARRVCEVAYESMVRGIERIRPGATLGDIGYAVQRYAESKGCSVVREYCGHGIGEGFHEDPQVLHYGEPGTGLKLEPGMIFTVEPMVNVGKPQTRLLPDGWTVVTRDRSLSAQWEHTVLVTDSGWEALTRLPGHPL